MSTTNSTRNDLVSNTGRRLTAWAIARPCYVVTESVWNKETKRVKYFIYKWGMLHTHIGRKPSVCVCVVVFGEDDAQEKESDHSTGAGDTEEHSNKI